MSIKNWLKKGALGIVGVVSVALCWFPLTPILGSWAAFFSVKAVLFPLAGAFAGVGGAVFLTGLRLLIRSLWGAALDAHILAHFLPGLCASLSWATRSSLMHVVLPLGCMFLFVIHPVGAQVWYYSLYWFIPVVVYLLSEYVLTGSLSASFTQKSAGTIYLSALESTFIAHAVGSVIWLYTVPMHAAVWQALLPLVAVERLIFAASMTAGYFVVAYSLRKMGACLYGACGYIRS